MNTLGSRNWIGVLLAVSLFLVAQASAGAGPAADHALWAKAIGEQAYLEECYGVQKTSDNGYILVGRRSLDTSGAKSNAFLVKTDANGTVQWSKEVDPYPSFASNSRLLDVVQANDGGYVAAGWVETPSYGDEGYLLKTDSTGAVQWQYIYGNGDPGSEDDSFASIDKTADGGYILAGVTEALAEHGLSDAWLVKVKADGYPEWSQVYGGNSLEYAYEAIEADGGYVFAGSTDSFGSETRVFVQKTSSTGAQQWLNVIDLNGSSDSGDQEGRSVKQTSDNGYIVGGWYEAGSDPGLPFLLKLNSKGTKEQWRQTYNLGSGSEKFSSIDLADDGGYIAVGRTNSAGSGSYDVLVAKTDALGTIEWSETYGGGDYDAAYSVQQTGDGGYIIGGKAVGLQWAGGTDMYLIRIVDYDHAVYLPLLLRASD